MLLWTRADSFPTQAMCNSTVPPVGGTSGHSGCRPLGESEVQHHHNPSVHTKFINLPRKINHKTNLATSVLGSCFQTNKLNFSRFLS